MLQIKTLEKTTIEQITNTFNSAFSDYSTPVKFTQAQFETKFASEGVRLDLSVGVFENEKLVAFILHFINIVNGKKYIYNGGTGVTPPFRGAKLTSQMYDFIIPKLKNESIDRMILEVFIDNFSALKIYQDRGFKILREVNCFNGKLNGTVQNRNGGRYEVEEIKELDWAKFQSFWDYQPTWQNSISTLNNLQKLNLCIGILKDEIIVGYLIYNPKNKRIHQIAIDKNYRNIGIGSQLLNYISKIETENISIINIDTKAYYLKRFLEKKGLKNSINQYEMEYNLKVY
ncbi:MAG: GNAT family N-acetyltransferase [Crocinitomicaceae bacterium]